ncbi:leucine--tRNA ligase [Candidatus Dependentiae bacterium]|nr:leucine--tRNA ligase [Candidatus Dependentiae bacterium]MBU4387466.1 leucine--tRNA ligase [Candidatus Dependentiae bacterium]MCG2756153.1 leucine--tRNA ligase [Candidatus Dependentiae bacterium]
MSYNFLEIEEKWQRYWEKKPYYNSKDNKNLKKYYCLDMFPYPSGSGLHVGHWKGYIFSDLYARIKFLQGYNVLHPMGWDAFGLPAENYALKNKVHPKISTQKNVEIFKKQIKQMGAIYDWTKEVNTTDPNYYKWTQWIFLQMFKKGLAYEDNMPINWCPSCLTGLANEEVVGGVCDRCGTQTEKKNIRQWVLKITEYAEKLLEGLDRLEWPEKVKLMQKNWIGKSKGANIIFKTESGIDLQVFTTRPDTLFGATFMVMAPDHELVEKIVTKDQKEKVKKYQEEVKNLSEIERTAENKDKTGVFTGAYAINPVNNKLIPIWLSSYVLKNYGTGIIMSVPAHDQRDFDFAKKFNLEILQVIKTDNDNNLTSAIEEDGILINSDKFNGLDAKTSGAQAIVEDLAQKNIAEFKTTYKLRDWIFSRQRYWGEPIPLIHCKKCGIVAVPENELPVILPEVENYQPSGTGESPLATIEDWVNTKCPTCNGPAKRETNTMPQWAGSCWYFLRYPNTDLKDKAFDSQDMQYWLPVDLYVGGIEHAVLHLLYSRFYIKVLYDLGYLKFDEPFTKLFNQGLVCMYSEKSGRVEKMSKSKGNVVNPDDIIKELGTDALRMYMLFMGPPEEDVVWQTDSIKGVKNFLNRLWIFLTNKENIVSEDENISQESLKRFHLFLKEFETRIENFKTNTAVSAIMEYLNDLTGKKLKLNKEILEMLLVAISTMVPHFSSELLERLLNKKLEDLSFPKYDPVLAEVNNIEIAIQINGKLRGTISTTKDQDQDFIEREAKKIVTKWLEGKIIVKTIYVSNKLISFVIK